MEWIRLGLLEIQTCDALLHLRNSPGADRELEFAELKELSIYKSVDDLPHAKKLDAIDEYENQLVFLLRSELSFIDNLLQKIPSENVIERLSLEAKKGHVQQQIKLLGSSDRE